MPGLPVRTGSTAALLVGWIIGALPIALALILLAIRFFAHRLMLGSFSSHLCSPFCRLLIGSNLWKFVVLAPRRFYGVKKLKCRSYSCSSSA
jgi:hypothetical protein